MSDTPHTDKLLSHAKALVALLEDPQPGLGTWRVALHQLLVKINKCGPGEPVSKIVDLRPKAYHIADVALRKLQEGAKTCDVGEHFEIRRIIAEAADECLGGG